MKSKKVLALLLSAGMTLSMIAGCSQENTPAVPADTVEDQSQGGNTDPAPDQGQTPAPAGDTTIVYATSTFGQKFSPFFATTAYDMEVVDLTQGGLLAADRGGAVINNGIAGENVVYNGSDYHYDGMGNVEVVQNADGSVDYNLTMKEGIKFSDGVANELTRSSSVAFLVSLVEGLVLIELTDDGDIWEVVVDIAL